jgi:hypothetical protein
MMNGWEGMGWAMGGMGILWILLLVLVVLGIAALAKYLMSGRK